MTARKTEESAQDVPVAMTAISAELALSTVRDLKDLNGYSANVRIDSDPSRAGAAAITIRGISPTRTDDNSFDSPIAVMIDGIYLGSLSGQVIENFDLERVEILRGPQGTLYGRNTVGGVVNAIRSRPTGEFGAKVQYTYGRWNTHEFRGVFNAPIVKDKLAVKGFFSSLNSDGWYYNEFRNARQPKKEYKNYGATFLFTPTEAFEAKLTVERFEDDSQGAAYLTNWNFAPGVLPPTGRPQDPNYAGGFLSCFLPGILGLPIDTVPCRTTIPFPKKTIATDLPNPGKVHTNAYTLDLSYELTDELKAVGLFGYRDMKEYRKYDFDGSTADHITIERDNDYEQFSGEVRLEGSWDTGMGKINALIGGYYWYSDFNQNWVTGGDFWTFIGALNGPALGGGYSLATNTWFDPVFANSVFPGLTPVGACLANKFGNTRCDTGAGDVAYGPKLVQKLFEDQKTTSQAIYAHADWEFLPGLTLEAGIRWTYEKKHFVAAQAYLAPLSRVDEFNFPEFADLKNSWKDISPKIGLSWKPNDDILIYGSYAEGWHSGGFFGVNQNVADFERDQYDPEHSRSFELGVKAQWFDNRLQTNIALFHNTFRDKQEQSVQFDPSTNTVATIFSNVANVIYKGIEAELQAAVTDGFNVFASVGLLDATYKKFETDITPNDGIPNLGDANFLTPRNAPKLTFGIGGTYTVTIGPGDLSMNVKYSYIDKVQGGLLNETLSQIPPRDDLSASITYFWEKYRVTIFGRNLTNERNEFPSIIAPLFASGTVGPGWSWGIELGAEF
ncbi:MAG: TonB-dependent receptor [Sphingomonadales bacterium]